MMTDTVVGIIVVVCGVSFLVWLMVRCRHIINRIAERNNPPLRDILEDFQNGR